VPWWDQYVHTPMDNPTDDRRQAGAEGEQEPGDNPSIVRRIEITVEREITTVILRRKDESSGPTLPLEPPAGEDGADGI
jgi:hypothetical protein